MKSKFFEVRDRATFVPVLATQLSSDMVKEINLIEKSGYDTKFPHLLLTKLGDGESVTMHDPFKWNDRTLKQAHQYIKQNWDDLSSGDVVDIEYILGETSEPKKSQVNM